MRKLIGEALVYSDGTAPAAALVVVSIILACVYAWNRSKYDNVGVGLYSLYALVGMAATGCIANGSNTPDVALKVLAWTTGISVVIQFITAMAHLVHGKPFLATTNYLATILSFSTATACGYHAGWDDGTTTSLRVVSQTSASFALAVAILPIAVMVGFGIKMLVDRYQDRKARKQVSMAANPHKVTVTEVKPTGSDKAPQPLPASK